MFARGFKAWCEKVAARHRSGLGLEPTDPLDPRALANHLGVQVWGADEVPGLDPRWLRILLNDEAESWSAVTLHENHKRLIIVNTAHRGGRPASNLAHELAHILLDHQPGRVDVSEDGLMLLNTYAAQQEDEARWLAGCLLLPREALVRCAGMNLEVAAKRYGVSVKMLRYRLDVTGVNMQMVHARRRR